MAILKQPPTLSSFIILTVTLHYQYEVSSAQTIPGCSGTAQTFCTGDYTLPGNFDVSMLDANVVHLTILPGPDHGSVVHLNHTALPLRETLFSVELSNFNQPERYPRFPLNSFIGPNKAHLRALDLNLVKLVSLTNEDFSGFNQLDSLYLDFVDIESISLTTFSSMDTTPAGIAIPNYQSTLKILHIRANPSLRSLDWSFLKPVSESLEVADLNSNNLESDNISCSIPFVLQRVDILNLGFNDLHRIPATVFHTLNTTLDLNLYLAGGRYCREPPSPTCDCCDMANFANWLRRHNQTEVVKEIGCGPKYGNLTTSTVFLANSYQRCGGL